MATRFSRCAQASSRGVKRTALRKHPNGKGRAFAGALKKKLNTLVTRNRIIQRSLHSIVARIDGRFKDSQHSSRDNCCALDWSYPSMEFETQNFPHDELVPQQQWDELFESAFEAIGDTSADIFNEQ